MFCMNVLTRILNQLKPKSATPLGRWRIENCTIKMSHKIDLSNEDHCGPCGQYALNKIKDNTPRILKKVVSTVSP
jgi:hypothetical protein